MTLSGYLFAKLLADKQINFVAFVWNRMLRLLPLLMVVILLVGMKAAFEGASLFNYARMIAAGVVYPTLPNGGWSITVEFHFYLLLPVLLWMTRKSKLLPMSILVGAVIARCVISVYRGEVQSLAYWTIVGRIDQFVLGVLICQFRTAFVARHWIALGTLVAFAAFYWLFDRSGGFYFNPSYPSSSSIWIALPFVEGLSYAVLIAWYDTSFTPRNTGFSKLVGNVGEYSYSIYLFHFFWVFSAARLIDEHVMELSNFYVACLWSLIAFALMTPLGYLSFRFIEAPFLRLRRPYVTTHFNSHGVSL